MNDKCADWLPRDIATTDAAMSMWITPDAPGSSSVFNAGVFLVRGTPAGRRIMDEWCALYRPSWWTRIPYDPSSSSSGSIQLGMCRRSHPVRTAATGEAAAVTAELAVAIRGGNVGGEGI